MLIWFAVASVVLVSVVFQSPGVDYRVVAAGAVLPLCEAVLGGPRVLHSMAGAVALLVAVMVLTRQRRLLRRRLLGLPIGVMAHLVLDGSFTDAAVFGWPFRGWAFAKGQLPELTHFGLSLVLELAGVALGFWGWRQFGLDNPVARRRFVASGRLDPPASHGGAFRPGAGPPSLP
ncbi:MAG: hypothetical protein ACR2MB_15750 [Acidimicrobiales bacterium]